MLAADPVAVASCLAVSCILVAAGAVVAALTAPPSDVMHEEYSDWQDV